MLDAITGGLRLIGNRVVNGVWRLGYAARFFGVFPRLLQFGRIQFYVCVTFGAVAAVLLWMMLAMPK